MTLVEIAQHMLDAPDQLAAALRAEMGGFPKVKQDETGPIRGATSISFTPLVSKN